MGRHRVTPYPNPDTRVRIELWCSESDAQAVLALRGDRDQHERVVVTDLETGERIVIAAADCGADCFCAAVILLREVA